MNAQNQKEKNYDPESYKAIIFEEYTFHYNNQNEKYINYRCSKRRNKLINCPVTIRKDKMEDTINYTKNKKKKDHNHKESVKKKDFSDLFRETIQRAESFLNEISNSLNKIIPEAKGNIFEHSEQFQANIFKETNQLISEAMSYFNEMKSKFDELSGQNNNPNENSDNTERSSLDTKTKKIRKNKVSKKNIESDHELQTENNTIFQNETATNENRYQGSMEMESKGNQNYNNDPTEKVRDNDQSLEKGEILVLGDLSTKSSKANNETLSDVEECGNIDLQDFSQEKLMDSYIKENFNCKKDPLTKGQLSSENFLQSDHKSEKKSNYIFRL